MARLSRLLLGPTLRRAARLVPGRWTISVVVAVTDDNATLLRSCVDAVLRPPRPADEVLLVVVGVSPQTRTVVSDQLGLRALLRTRTIELAGATVAEAMNVGAARASSRLLRFCAPGDEIVEGALAAAVEALKAADADIVGATVDDLGRRQLGDVVVSRSLWRRASIQVPEGPHGPWWAAARALLTARRAVPAPALRSDTRTVGVSFGTMPCLAPWVGRWWADTRSLREDLAGHEAGARARFLHWLLDVELSTYLMDAERCTDEEWSVMSAAARELIGNATHETLCELHVESRVRLMLAVAGHRHELARYNAERWLADGQFPTRVQDGEVFADLPVPRGVLAPEALALGVVDTPLVAQLRTMRWRDPECVELDLFVFIRGVDSGAGSPSASFWLVRPDGRRTALAAQRRDDSEVNLTSGERFTDHRRNAFTVRVDAARALEQAAAGERWYVEIELQQAGVVRSGGLTDVHLEGGAASLPARAPGGLTLRPRREDERWHLMVERPHADEGRSCGEWTVTDVELGDGEIVVRGTAAAEIAAGVELRGAGTAHAGAVVEGGAFESRIALEHEPWQLTRRPLPSGPYRIWLHPAGGKSLRPRMSPDLAARTPYWQRSPVHRARVQRQRDGAVLVTLASPLAEDEVGPYAQQQLRHWYASTERRLDEQAVYLQSYTGRSATDSPLAIHHALRALRPDLRLLWAVADRSTVLPEGGEPLLMRSREWYAALASCRYLVTNIDMDPWFVKHPGQRLLQSFHGYPSKTMGLSAWRAKNFTPLRIRRQLARTSGTWDLLLTPTPSMDVHYRREYCYEGEILSTGYPRDDVLLGPLAGRIRSRTRSRLGVADGQRVVLYAPTWRDDLATNFRSAAMSTTFDAESALDELGDDFVILLRGHRFHRRRGDIRARIVDVTDYPEINDLILAADVAVLDYSSLRFDFALTGRPMVFLVPDLDRYAGGVRGFLFDFRDSAPGPLVGSTSEVVAQLRDLEDLSRRYRTDLERFNLEFNPLQDAHAAERVVDAFFGAAPGHGR